MEIIQHEQGSQSWLDWRKTKRMASEASVVTGRNPWQKPIQLARVKRGMDEVKTNFAMRRGTAYEEEARQWFQNEMGLVGMPIVLGLGDYGASLDWYSIDFDPETGEQKYAMFAEFKVPQSENSELWKSVCDGVIPEYYLDQMTQQWAVTGADEAWFCVYLPEMKEGRIIKYEYSPARWNEIQKAWDVFWEMYMIDALNPDDFERCDEAWLSAVERFRDAKNEMEAAQATMDKAKADLIELAGGKSTKGCGLSLVRIEKHGSIAYAKAVKALKLDMAQFEPFRGEATVSYRIDV